MRKNLNKTKFHSSLRQNQGFMMLEVIIVVSIITVSMLVAMVVAEKSVLVGRQAVHTTQASFLLEEGAEAVRILRDNNWSNISNLTSSTNYYPVFSGGTWTLSLTPNTVDTFTRTISISGVLRDNTTKDISSSGTDDPGTKLVTVGISWVEGGATISKNLSFYISDIF